jgi:sulfatase maturation enzyme AslB (radical SAM superfamily)
VLNNLLRKFKIIYNAIYGIVVNLIIWKKQTHCHLLWDSIFVDNKGNVYTCCHYKPWKIGNIYKKHLSAIIGESRLLKLYKFMSLNKCLYCSFGCTLIPEHLKGTRPALEMKYNHPRRILVLCGELCNINCIMCPQDHRSKEVINAEIAKKNIDWSQYEEIMFQGGEVLAMKEAKELYLWLTRTLNKKIDLLTNGILINDEWADYLVNGSNVVAISVNAASKKVHELINNGSDFTRVVNNIKKLVELKRQQKQGVQIIYKFSIVPENVHEIPDAICFANSIGCDQITYGFDSSVPDYLESNGELRSSIKHRMASAISNGISIKVDKSYLERLGLV